MTRRSTIRSLKLLRIASLTAAALCVSCTPDDGGDPSSSDRTAWVEAVWAHDGGRQVPRHELRAQDDPASVISRTWDGETIRLHGARNETISFSLVLEAPYEPDSPSSKTEEARRPQRRGTPATAKADPAISALEPPPPNHVSLSLSSLRGPDGFEIASRELFEDWNTRYESRDEALRNDCFDWRERNVEMFLVGYLQVKGLSSDLVYDHYDERHIPEGLRHPYGEFGEGRGEWTDRPHHDAFYPAMAIPLELLSAGDGGMGSFDLRRGENQSIWIDVYIPGDAPAGRYSGELFVYDMSLQWTQGIPVSLQVYDFNLPARPSAKTMLYVGDEDIYERYLGSTEIEPGGDEEARGRKIRDRHFQMARRHRITLFDANSGAGAWAEDRPRDAWIPRLDGTLYTADQGYCGPGEGLGEDLFVIGAYGSWAWQDQGEAGMQVHTDQWAAWFDQHAPDAELLLYLADEPDPADYEEINRWGSWLRGNPGPGARIRSLVTAPWPEAIDAMPDVDVLASWSTLGDPETWEAARDRLAADSRRSAYLYNGRRPMSGTFALEDDGIALRQLAWAQFKMGIERWFYWESTYYTNFQGNTGRTDVFTTAQTFGDFDEIDPVLGETGFNYVNGDGVLFYPGTDEVYPDSSYDIDGPIAGLRLKHWRRGIQDADYLTLAAEVDPLATQRVVDDLVPVALWDYGVEDPADPTWVLTDISWSIDPDDWEAARAELAGIITRAAGD